MDTLLLVGLGIVIGAALFLGVFAIAATMFSSVISRREERALELREGKGKR